MQCVRRIIATVKSQPLHFDLAGARKFNQDRRTPENPPQDFLVFSLNELIKIAFTTATSDIEALRPIGVDVMRDVVEVFFLFYFIY